MIEAAVGAIRLKSALEPRLGVVLGSGLGAFADELSERTEIDYADIPGWPRSTAVGHAGRLVLGSLEGVPMAVLAGRAHLYEGYTTAQVVFPIRVLRRLGVESIVFTNAAGGINLSYAQGALVLISDHINMQGINPLSGPNDDSLGPRFPDMSEAYSQRFREIARDAAGALGIELTEGVYVALLGPSYETPAEIRALRTLGADLVGMSTVPEAIAANHMGMKVLGISCVTNMAAGILRQKINHEEVLETGNRVRGTLIKLLRSIVPRLAKESEGARSSS
jgi:purine-nucleoside phosphorylase